MRTSTGSIGVTKIAQKHSCARKAEVHHHRKRRQQRDGDLAGAMTMAVTKAHPHHARHGRGGTGAVAAAQQCGFKFFQMAPSSKGMGACTMSCGCGVEATKARYSGNHATMSTRCAQPPSRRARARMQLDCQPSRAGTPPRFSRRMSGTAPPFHIAELDDDHHSTPPTARPSRPGPAP